MSASDFGTSDQKVIISMVDDFLIEAQKPLEEKITDFPESDTLFPSGKINYSKIAEYIAKYEFNLVQISNRLSGFMVKRLQLKLFLGRVLKRHGKVSAATFSEDVNFYISRLMDAENIFRSKVDTIKECIGALRSIQTNASR